MIFNVNRKEMLALAKKVARASPSGTSAERGILLEANDRAGILVMTATNLQVSIRVILPASIETGGSVVIPGGLLIGMLEQLSGDTVYIEAQHNQTLYASGDKAWYQVAVQPPDNYPKVDIPLPGDGVMVTGLKSLIANAKIAVPKTASESNPVLNCIELSFSKDGLRASAGGCLGVVQVTGDRESVGEISLLVPASSLKLLTSVCQDSDVFSVGITGPGAVGKQVVFHDGTLTFAARLMEGKHLDMDQLFDNFAPVTKAVLGAESLKNALGSVMTVADSSDTVEIQFHAAGLTLRCDTAFGESSIIVRGVIEAPSNSPAHLNAYRLMECLRTIDGDIMMLFSKEGHLVIQTDKIRYMQPAMRPKKTKSKQPSKKKAA